MLELLTNPIAEAVARHLCVETTAVSGLFSTPAKGVAADIALPCFQLAKVKGTNPAALSGELAQVIAKANLPVAAAATGPFLNITFTSAGAAKAILSVTAREPLAPLRSHLGGGKTVCIDFSSPNIAKHLAFHHIRSTMIGNALSRQFAAVGFKVVRINFIGDWGTSFGRLIAGWKRENLQLTDLEQSEDKVTFLNALYVRISAAAKQDASVEEEARLWSKKLEDGDLGARQLWEIFKKVSLAEFDRVYKLLDVGFDSWKGEAYYEDKMGPVLAELERKGLTTIDQGATVVDLSKQGFSKPALIKRADGGTLYATRDLAACDDRFAEYRFDRSLYVVDLGQALHFKEWFAIAKLMGRPYADALKHIGFGLVLIWNDEKQGWEKTATRRGVPMLLIDVLNEAIDRARAIVAEKNPDLPKAEADGVAQAVGVGAVVFNDLKNSRTNDVKFKFEDALNMQGETGPYLQFAHARLCSIERKATAEVGKATADPALLTLEAEKVAVLAIARMRSALERSVESAEPSILAQALLALSSAISGWLTAGNADVNLRVLCPDPATSSARLALVRAARATLGEGLRLLGLQAPERM